MEGEPQWKTTPNGRRPQSIKSGTSQQPIIESFSKSKLKHRGPNSKIKIALHENDIQWKTTSEYEKLNI